jgi:hypothetical protein
LASLELRIAIEFFGILTRRDFSPFPHRGARMRTVTRFLQRKQAVSKRAVGLPLNDFDGARSERVTRLIPI